jgi:hypothetical protein
MSKKRYFICCTYVVPIKRNGLQSIDLQAITKIIVAPPGLEPGFKV